MTTRPAGTSLRVKTKESKQLLLDFFCLFHWTTKQQFCTDAWFQQIEKRDTERTFAYLVQLTHRGMGEKKKERRIGVDLTSCTGKTER